MNGLRSASFAPFAVVVVAFISFYSPAVAEDVSEGHTNGRMNGVAWDRMDELTRSIYIRALFDERAEICELQILTLGKASDGSSVCVCRGEKELGTVEVASGGMVADVPSVAVHPLCQIPIAGMKSFKPLVEEVSRIYGTPGNRIIPIVGAVEAALFFVSGNWTEAALQENLARKRKYYTGAGLSTQR